jgi:hypothetical protein
VCVCVCVFVLLSLDCALDHFQGDSRCLFSPHQVNHGGVQKSPPEVSLYKFHTRLKNLSETFCCTVEK